MKKKPQRSVNQFQSILFDKLKNVEKKQQEIVSLRLQLSNALKIVESDKSLDYYARRNRVLNMRVRMLELNIETAKLQKESKAILKDLELYEYVTKRASYSSSEYREKYELTELLKMIEQHSIELEIISYEKEICGLKKEIAYLEKDLGLITTSEREKLILEQNKKIANLDASRRIVLEGTQDHGYTITEGLNYEVRFYIEKVLGIYERTNIITREEFSQAHSTLLGKEELSEKDVHVALEMIEQKEKQVLSKRK